MAGFSLDCTGDPSPRRADRRPAAAENGARSAVVAAVAADRGARFVCDITLTRSECPTAAGSRCAVRLAGRAGGGARHIALGKNPKKSPHDGGLDLGVEKLRTG